MPLEDVTGSFGGIFAFLYVGVEVVLKLFSSVVRDNWTSGGKVFVFLFYAICAVVSAFGMTFIKKLPKDEPDSAEDASAAHPGVLTLMTKKLKAIKVCAEDPKIWLLGPLNVAFGFCGIR